MAMRRRDDLTRGYGPAVAGGVIQPFEKQLTLAQMQALFTTPVQVTDAPGADKIIVPTFMVVEKTAGTAFTIGTAGDFAISYGAAGAIVLALAPAAFFDQATLESRVVYPKATGAGAALTQISAIVAGSVNLRNTPLFVRQLTANMTVGTGSITRVHIYGHIIPVNLTFSW